MQRGLQHQADDHGVDEYPAHVADHLDDFRRDVVSFKCSTTIPLSRELCGPKVESIAGPGHGANDTSRAVGDQNRVNLYKRVSELASVPYVTVRARG